LSGSIIDLIITKHGSSLIKNPHVILGLSDHSAVVFTISCKGSSPQTSQTQNVRHFHKINVDLFQNDLHQSVTIPICNLVASTFANEGSIPSPESLVNLFNTSVNQVLDIHAPKKVSKLIIKKRPPWFNCQVLEARKELRKTERLSRTCHTLHQRLTIMKCKSNLRTAIQDAKKSYWLHISDDFKANPKLMWSHLLSCVGRKMPATLPKDMNSEESARRFSQFFSDKIETLRGKISLSPASSSPIVISQHNCTESLSSFTLATEKEVEREIRISTSTSSPHDPIPTWLLKRCLHYLLPCLTIIINACISQGLPPAYKHALIRPLYKKGSKCSDDVSCYRPISNLPFLAHYFPSL
jgi:hypothetical protein